MDIIILEDIIMDPAVTLPMIIGWFIQTHIYIMLEISILMIGELNLMQAMQYHLTTYKRQREFQEVVNEIAGTPEATWSHSVEGDELTLNIKLSSGS
ncbi:MAG: hypothetical protein U5Q03_18180 [Bacteroidota bacterium]|nr:hypothetical protein [Bacteroidota bacterium]